MNKPLTGKVALVTGGSRGLGAATVRLLAEQGADVAFTYVSSEHRAQAVVEEVRGNGAKAVALRSDQAETSGAPALIDEVVAHFGGLDILVNNAAISVAGRTVDDPDADTAALDRMHATNYLGVIAIIRAASRVLRTDGRIITVSSGLGTRVGLPGNADYSATKAGIERYTMGVARDLGPRDITANVVEAGLMEGGMETTPETLKALLSTLSLQRKGHPQEIAAAIAFLASPAASYITGAVLDAHGGYNA
ncbi:SDR family NAD(P)-dependent oxidoreductase [Nonomuraea terrae]|uniref:SDR family NAD(P)-dependent oxidoreductase n=1 Tax=Nonomuraea terrae TaxID=2530383 RepID=UPI0037BBFDF6